ncbi:MAG: hypothetical protein R3214_01690 [Christiangramia sp.]|nr:hypothetical protein [Christiangramia sp.]
MEKALVWFRNDLRISDNESLVTLHILHEKVTGVHLFYSGQCERFKKTMLSHYEYQDQWLKN